jgi:hypothetical protein
MEFRTGLDAEDKKNISAPARISNPGYPARSMWQKEVTKHRSYQ